METTNTEQRIGPLTALERETTLTMNDGEPTVRINTAQRRILTALRKKPTVFREIATGFHGTTEWAEFEVDTSEVSFNLAASGRERRQLTEDQRQELSNRMTRNLHR